MMNSFNESDNLKKILGDSTNVVIIGFLAVLLFWGATTGYYTVRPEEEAVIFRFGKYIKTAPPGLHFKLPFGVDRKILVKTKIIHTEEFGFRTDMSKRVQSFDSIKSRFDQVSLMLTGDLNVADVKWVVFYKISDPFKYLVKARDPIKNIRDVSESIMRRVIGDRLVSDVLTTGRIEIGTEAKILMQEVLDKYDFGILVTSVKLKETNPPDVVKPSFNEVNEAKQEKEKMINQAEKQYNKIIPEARGQAEKVVSDAEGFSMLRINQAYGDAKKFDSQRNAFIRSPEINRRRIYLETMETLFENMDNVLIIDQKTKGILPIFNNLSAQDVLKGEAQR